MSAAKVHSHQSNRAKSAESQKKVVFKPVLDNPFRVYWPSVPVNLQNLVLAQTSTILDGVAEYQRSKISLQRKRKREKCDETRNNVDPTPPPIISHLTVGINAVTKCLEGQLGLRRKNIKITSASDSIDPQDYPLSSSTQPSIRVVLVCRADVNPPILIDHIPHIVAAFNSSLPSHQDKEKPILLIPLPSGAEHTLADLLGLRRVAVLALDDETPNLSTLFKNSEKIPVITAPWLVPLPPQQIIPTHIKQVRTTAPKDMKVAKEQRAAGRKASKARKKEKKTEAA